MTECAKSIWKWVLTKFLKASAKLLIIAFLVLVTGTVMAATGNISSDTGEVNLVYVVSGVSAINILTVGIWVGKSNKTQKFLEQAIITLGEKNDNVFDKVTIVDKSSSNLGTTVKEHGKRIGKLEDIQRDCFWTNRHPDEFAKN